MAILHVVGGLPGAGKSKLLAEMRASGVYVASEDFFAYSGTGKVPNAPSVAALVERLRSGQECAIGDIVFIHAVKRNELAAYLGQHAPGTEFRWIVYRPDLAQCAWNCLHKNRQNEAQVRDWLLAIVQWADKYDPTGVTEELDPVMPHGRCPHNQPA